MLPWHPGVGGSGLSPPPGGGRVHDAALGVSGVQAASRCLLQGPEVTYVWEECVG